jgi:Putative transposase, YhgA-like
MVAAHTKGSRACGIRNFLTDTQRLLCWKLEHLSLYQRINNANRVLIPDPARVEMSASALSHALYRSLVRDSDSLYHRLFSHPLMVEALVREFVPEALAIGLDFSNLQRVNPKFNFRRLSGRRRDGDVIWRLPTCKGTDIYLYLLIEFQSRVDWWMAVRTQVYTGLLWQQVIDEKDLRKGAQLPPLLLLVLYNGKKEWQAPTRIQELIALSGNSALWPWQPQVQYYLLNIGAFPKDDLVRRTSLAALLFRLEKPQGPYELERLLAEVIGWFREHEGYERLRELFAELVREAFAALKIPVPKSEDMLHMKTRLSETVKDWAKQWKAEGLAEGKAEGKAQGKAEGKAEAKAEALVCLLTERFGTVRPSLRKRIQGAKPATVDSWFKRAIAAPDLLSVFTRPR